MFQIWLQVLKYGFSTVLIGAGLTLAVLAWREGRSLRSLFRGFGFVSFPLVFAGLVLALFTGESTSDFSLFFIKAISTAFGLIYGIYATLNGFIETDKETGQRIVTKLGIVGIFLLSFNTVLTVTMDYLQEAAGLEAKLQDKEEALKLEMERKREYEKLLGSVGFVGQRAGDLKIDFEKFSQSLYQSLIAVETDLKKTRTDLAARETELKDTVVRLGIAESGLRDSQEIRSRLEKSLGGAEADLKSTLGRVEEAEASRKAALDAAGKKEQELAGTIAKLKETQDNLSGRQVDVAKLQEQLTAVSRNSASFEAELREARTRLASAEGALKVSQEEAKKSAASVAARDVEVKYLQAQTQRLDQQAAQLQQQILSLQQQNQQLQAQLQKMCIRDSSVRTNRPAVICLDNDSADQRPWQ